MVCLPFIGLGRSALRRAENIAPRAGRTAIAFAMHAIDGVRVDEIVDGFAFARTRSAIAFSAHPLTPGRS